MTDKPFFIDKLPSDASYCMRREFRDIHGRSSKGYRQVLNEFQAVDPRLTESDVRRVESLPIPPEFASYFQIKDIHEATEGGNEALCSVSFYNPVFEMTGNEWDSYIKKFQTYTDGLQILIDVYKKVLPGQTIRVYVGDNVWDELYKQGFFDAKQVEFIRMEHDSRRTYLGSLWRFLAIDDFDYEYMYVTDVDETWENRMILDTQELSYRLEKGTSSQVHIASAVTFTIEQNCFNEDPNWSEIPVFFDVRVPMRDSSMMARLSNYCLLNACTFTRGPRQLPFTSIVPFLCHFLQKSDDIVLYHPPTNQWTSFLTIPHHHDYNQMDEHWLFPLCRVLDVKHWIPNLSNVMSMVDRVKNWYGEDCFVNRMCCQMIREGNYFLIENAEDRGYLFDAI